VGKHVSDFRTAWASQDHVGEGMAGLDLAVDATAVGGGTTGVIGMTRRVETAVARRMSEQSKPVIVGENASGLGKNPKFFKTETNWTAPSSGTGQMYKVYQQEIDWALEVDGATNLQRAQGGRAPFVMRNDKPQQLQLHHSRQDARGSLFELSEPTHLRTRSGHGREALHPYGRQQHPGYPVNRPDFNKDVKQYWRDRVEGIKP